MFNYDNDHNTDDANDGDGNSCVWLTSCLLYPGTVLRVLHVLIHFMFKTTKTSESENYREQNSGQEESRATKVSYCLEFSAPSFLLFGGHDFFHFCDESGVIIHSA
jgi:hypothetical protein